MATEDRKISQLPSKSTGILDADLAAANPVFRQTQKAKAQELIGAVRAEFPWQADTTYAIGDFVFYNNLTAWRSLQNSNTGNVPAENTWWTKEPISIGDGITLTPHSNGLFTYNSSLILSSNIIYKLANPAPFKSTDIAAEINNGDWDAIGIDSGNEAVEITIYNNDSVAFNVFDIVNFPSGSTGGLVNAVLAIASTPSLGGLAMITEPIAAGSPGKATEVGPVFGDSSSFTADAQLYLSDSIAGGSTSVAPKYAYPVGRVLVQSATGTIFAYMRDIINRPAVAQSKGSGNTQTATTTPTEISVFDLTPTYSLNTIINQIAGTGSALTSQISPALAGDAGLYEVVFDASITTPTNTIVTLELYFYDSSVPAWVATGVTYDIDFSINNLDDGSISFTELFTTELELNDKVAMYVYSTASNTLTFNNITFYAKKLFTV